MEKIVPQQAAAVSARRKRRLSKLFARWEYLVMILPGLIVLLINNYIPMLGLSMAFQKYQNIPKPAHGPLTWLPQYYYNIIQCFVQGKVPIFSSLVNGQLTQSKNILTNFLFLFHTPDSWTMIRNTVLYNIVFIILGLIIAVAFAIILSELRNRRTSKIYQSLMFLPYFLSWVIVSYLAYGFLGPDKGFINKSIIEPLGGKAVQFYTEPLYWPFILIFFNLWKYTGYNCVVYLAALTSIDPEFYEAATIDGASRWQRIRHITLPNLQPLMIILTVLAIGRVFNSDFGLFYQLPRQQGALFPATLTIDVYVFNTMRNLSDYSMAAAAGLLQSVVGFIFVFTANKVVQKLDHDKAVF